MKQGSFLSKSLIFAIFVTMVGCAKNPVTGKNELSLISESDEIALGMQSRPEVLHEFNGLYRNRRVQAYVGSVCSKLATVSHRPKLPYSFDVLNSSDINAFALPGGKLFITRGLLGRLHNEAQLAGVMGHEIGHVTAKHAVRSMSSTLLLQIPLLVGAAYADAKGKGEYLVVLGAISANLLQLRFSRQHESQSDRLGIEYSAKAGYSPEGMVQVLEVLQEAAPSEPSKFASMFSSHPLTSKRIEEAQEIVAQNYPDLESLNYAWNPEGFENNTRLMKQEQPAFDDYDLAESARAEGRYTDALTLYNKAISQVPEEPVFYVGRGLIYREMAEPEKARADVRQAVALSGDLYSAQLALGRLELENNNPQVAVSALTKSVDLYPKGVEPYYYLGQIAENDGDTDEAERFYGLVTELSESDSDMNALGRQGLARVGGSSD